MKKIISAFLITVFALALFACKTEKPAETVEETDEPEYVFTDVSGVPSPLSVDGEEIPYSTFRYYYSLVKYKYDNGDDSYWDTHDYSADILDEAALYLRRDLATKQYAEQLNVSLSDYDISQVKESIRNASYYYGSEYEYNEMLDDNFLTPGLYEELNMIDSLRDKLLEYLTGEESGYKISSDKTLVNRYLNNYVSRADHILILNDPGDDVNENETLINEIYDKLIGGEDFEALKEQYSEDRKSTDNENGYYFAEGDIGKEFEEAALALQIGQMSDIVKTHYGYHIIIRLPLDEEYIKENEDHFVSFYQEHMLKLAINKVKDAQKIEYDPSFYTYTPKNIK